jgi:hypothetical protein
MKRRIILAGGSGLLGQALASYFQQLGFEIIILTIILVFAFAASVVGNVLGIMHGSDYSGWENLALTPGILDLPSFVRVAYTHNASYLSGLIGLVAAIIYLRKLRNTDPDAAAHAIQPFRSETNQTSSAAGSRR